MPHQFLIFTDASGSILDTHFQPNVRRALGGSLQVRELFLYSHGWWTTAESATEVYNRFSIEFADSAAALAAEVPVTPAFGIGVHWPSMLSEDRDNVLNVGEALSYFGMATRANAVGSNAGYALLRSVLESRRENPAPLRVHLIGHSFGCKVVCMALQRLVDKGILDAGLPDGVSLDVALIQAAFNDDELEDTRIADYENVIGGVPGLRMLVTTSTEDRALRTQFRAAQGIANLFDRARPALGDSGPTPREVALFGDRLDLPIEPGFRFGSAPALKDKRLVVADLSPVHRANVGFQKDAGLSQVSFDFSGHHSDIYLPEIYSLLLSFYFG